MTKKKKTSEYTELEKKLPFSQKMRTPQTLNTETKVDRHSERRQRYSYKNC